MTVHVRTALAPDLDAVVALLACAGLSTAGVVRLVAAGLVLVAEDLYDGVIGCIAVEPLGDQVLVRCLAVLPTRRNEGIGGRLLTEAVDAVPLHQEIWVLTETAAPFLERHGFEPVAPVLVTGPVTRTQDWASSCPTAATPMRLTEHVQAR
jgi:N-acetylglutamate synthase-like GNAT family acetyltransferase